MSPLKELFAAPEMQNTARLHQDHSSVAPEQEG